MSLYSSASDYAKDTWLPVYPDMLTKSQGSVLELLGLNTDERVKIEGRRAFMKIQVGDDLGFGIVTSPGGDLATPGDIASAEARLDLMRFNDAIEFDAHEMALLDSLDAAAAPIMQKKMSASAIRSLREIERMALMDGTGALAKVASISTPTIVLDVVGNAYTERNPYTWIDDPGRSRYRSVDPTTGANKITALAASTTGFTISLINESTNTITASVATTGTTAGDLIVTDYGISAFSVGGVYTSPEMVGLLGMIASSGTYMNVSRTTYPQWQSTVISNSGTLRDISDNLVHELMNKTGRRSEKGMLVPSEYCGLADPGVWTSYHNLMSNGIRYTVSENPDIGWGGREMISMNGVPLYKHSMAARHQIMLVHKESAGFVGAKHDHNSIVKFLDRNGSIFFQQTASAGQGYADKTVAYITGFIGMYTERPRNHGRLDDLNLTAPAYAGQ